MKGTLFSFAILLPTLLLAACATNPAENAPTTRPAFLSAPATEANSDYWFNKPAVASVESPDFQKLWTACRATAINDQFEIDQEDYRLGLLTTYPMISKQFFEFWRSDAGDLHGVAWDSLQTIRRTIRFDFTRQPDGSFIVYPKVLIETSAHPERRITSQAQYSQAFNSASENPTIVNDQGVSVPTRYWYSVGRDDAMEKELANSVHEKLDN